MNEELTAIKSPHNNAGRRKGAITEINQIAMLLSQVCMRMKSTTINRPHNNTGRRKGKLGNNRRLGSFVGPHVKVTCTFVELVIIFFYFFRITK
jgi:hypothetical protein